MLDIIYSLMWNGAIDNVVNINIDLYWHSCISTLEYNDLNIQNTELPKLENY